ncbi:MULTISPECIES: peptidylprolyl isomerase [Pseudovibrio]|uniref:peptidylprolyl isomerase n=1 Tax=Stappiaceae TaxID=2821832 RepID=UPI0023651387|nr:MULTISPECIES: peptidylprolyl isomerase [Pseudovibrio]MDD7909309.1 peptidylprolyl isomerase [Pseudovibrio exalbescens]MDX5594869.1 peptidylprolyl isomerase [Pseudovibrio sp. SPO723]
MLPKFSSVLKSSAAVVALVIGLGSVSAFAQDVDNVVATVDKAEITEGDLAYAAQDYASQLQRVPPTEWRGVLTDVLVEMNLLANAAEAESLQDDPDFKRLMEFERTRALRNAYFQKFIQNSVTEDDIKAAYDEQYADYKGDTEVSARHILLETEEDAKAVIAELDGGADFAELAKEKSTGPSGQNGGQLGFFGKGQMVPEFEEAAFAQEPGSYSKEPVKSQFGFHVILVEEARERPAPELAQVSDQIRQNLILDKFRATVEELREKAEVNIVEPEAAADEADQAEETAN